MKRFLATVSVFILLGALGQPAMGGNQMTLFFFDRELGLIPFTRTVTGQVDARAVVEQLLRGPDPRTGLPNHFPRGTHLINVQTRSATAYVNLSSEFVANYDPNRGDPLWLDEIEFSLLQLPEVEAVVLLVDGQVLDEYRDISLSWPVSQDRLLGVNLDGILGAGDWRVNVYLPAKVGQVDVLIPKTRRVASLVELFEALLQEVGSRSVRVQEVRLTDDRLILKLNGEAEELFRGSSVCTTSLLYTASEVPGIVTLELFAGPKQVGKWQVPNNPPGIIAIPGGLNDETHF